MAEKRKEKRNIRSLLSILIRMPEQGQKKITLNYIHDEFWTSKQFLQKKIGDYKKDACDGIYVI